MAAQKRSSLVAKRLKMLPSDTPARRAMSTVLAEDFYAALQRPYATDLLADQHLGANIGWASGDIPMALVMAAVFVQWVRSDEQDAKRSDSRQEAAAAGGEGVDELADYNAYLARLAERDRTQD